jgi:hypothetical protein
LRDSSLIVLRGSIQPLKLLRSNLSDFEHQITWESLPKTFQDAVVFTRHLNIRYLWIDSLCILQDSREDWEEQASKMATIYESAILTLCAAAAKDGSVGCFAQPPDFATGFVTDGETTESLGDTAATARFLGDPNQEPKVLVRELVKHETPSRKPLRYTVWNSVPRAYSSIINLSDAPLPLLQRGWVFQERVLSPRILYFGHVDLLWECSQSVSCHCGLWDGFREEERPEKDRPQGQYKNKFNYSWVLRNSTHDQLALNMWWRTALGHYTNMLLSKQTDRLPAIAGIARQISRHMKNPKYLAGLWEQSLTTDLLWYETEQGDYDNCDDIYRPRLVPAKVKSPTWSWASAPARIRYGVHHTSATAGVAINADHYPRILEADCNAHGDQFLGVEGGRIKLSGQMTSGRLLGSPRLLFEVAIKRDSLLSLAAIPVRLDSGFGSLPDQWTGVASEHQRKGNGMVFEYQDDVWVLRMGCWRMGEWTSGPYGCYEHFLLLKCADETEGVYKRIGMGWYYEHGNEPLKDASERTIVLI